MSIVDLRLGEALQVMATLDAGSIDAIITDLPYGTTACSWDEIIPFEPMWVQVKRILKPRGVFVTTASQPFTSKLVMSNLEWFKYEWVWEKSLAMNFLDVNIKPLKAHENICVFYSGGITYNPQKTQGKPWKKTDRNPDRAAQYGSIKPQNRKSDGGRFPRSVIEFSNGNNNNNGHPTQKPVALYTYLVLTYTNPSDTVLDFCMGSGTTGVSCVNTGRNFIGCDNNAEYYEIAKKRIEQAQMQLRMEI